MSMVGRTGLRLLGLLALAGCADVLAPALTVQFDRAGAHLSVRDDSLAVFVDSVRVQLSGPGADTAHWVAAHSGAGVLTLQDSTGAGSGWVRWTHDATLLAAGDYVDSIAVAVPGADAAALLVESLTVRPYPTRFITVRRAWRPGERDSVVTRVMATRAFTFPYVGDISDDAATLIPTDSTLEIVANPAFQPSRLGRPGMLFSTYAQIPNGSWTVTGLRIRTVNNNQAAETYDWMGYFFYNTAVPTWRGLVIGDRQGNGLNRVVDTPAWDASNAQSGAGGGEMQASTGTYWQANNTGGGTNKIRVTAASFSGTAVTVTTGPFLGGTRTDGTMTGALQQVVFTRVVGSAGDAADTADVTLNAIPAAFYECIFPTPCTTNVLRALPGRALVRAGTPSTR